MIRRAGRSRPGSLAPVQAGVLVCGMMCGVLSCTSSHGSSLLPAPGRARAALDRLEQRAEAEQTEPIRGGAADLPPPFPTMVPISRDSQRWSHADASPQTALRAIVAESKLGSDPQPTPTLPDTTNASDATGNADTDALRSQGHTVVAGVIDTEDHTRALALYAEARQRSADDGTARAIRLLEEASELEPDSPEIWRALGDAKRAAGFANSAGAAFTRAAELGISEPEALTLAGLHEIEQGKTTAGAAFLARAVTATPAHADPLVSEIAAAALGEALIDLGWTRAGCEALDAGLQIGPAAIVPTNLGIEAVALRRRLADLLVRLGDARSSLDEPGPAADAYRRAAGEPDGARPEIRSRLVYALRRAGRSDEAALVLIDDLMNAAPATPSTLAAFSSLGQEIRPRMLVADAISGIDPAGSPARAADLVLARAAALPDADARRLLSSALLARAMDGDLGSSADSASLATASERGQARLVAALLERIPETRAVPEMSSLAANWPVLARPIVAAMLLRTQSPESLPERLARDAEAGARFRLLAEHALATQNRTRLIAVLERANHLSRSSPVDADHEALRARLAASVGEWTDYEDALVALHAEPTADQPLIVALEAGQRFSEAFPIAQRLAEKPDAGVDDELRLAALAGQLANTDAGRGALVRAAALDPYDDRVADALLAFHSPSGPMPDNDLRTEAARLLREHSPGGTLLRQLFAAELIRRGLLDEAVPRLAALFAEDPTHPQTLDALLALWTRLAAADRSAEIDLTTAEVAFTRHPASPGLARLIAGGELLLDRPEDAIATIDTFESNTGSPALARLREKVIAEQLGDLDRAQRLAAERLSPEPRSIDQSLELASRDASALKGEPDQGERLGRVLSELRAIPDDAELTRAQLGPVESIVSAVAVHLGAHREHNTDPDESAGPARDGLAIFDWAADRSISFAPALHSLRLTLLAESDAPFERLAAAADDAISAYPGSERAFARRMADLLIARSRTSEAYQWVGDRVFTEDGSLDPAMLTEWVRLPIINADTDAARVIIKSLENRGALLEAWRALRNGQDDLPGRDGSTPAEFAYLLAQYASATADPGSALVFLRLALEYDPHHPWVANDLGYRLLEGEGSVIEAERLISIAYDQLSDEAAIVDSLGWARYHLGHLEDTTDPKSGAVIPGAVSLLRRAAELAGDDDDGVVSDHLGDALYRAGHEQEAARAWGDAARQANRLLSRLRASGSAGGIRSREIQSLASRAAMKRNAVQLNQPPAIEPMRAAESVPNIEPGTSPDQAP